MESCSRNRMILMSIAILGICSIGESEGFFLRNLLSETQTHKENIPLPTYQNTNQTVLHEIHRNVSEKLESTTQIVNSLRTILTSVLDDHTLDKSTNVPEENNQIVVDVKSNEVPTAEHVVDDNDLNNAEVSIIKLPEQDSEDMVTVLEDNIRSSVKDEIQLDQNESSAIDVIDEIPDPEVRQTLTEDLMAIEYPQSVKKPEERESVSSTTVAASIKEANVGASETPADETPVATEMEVTAANYTPEVPSDSTTPNPEFLEETTIIPTKLENSHSLETLVDPNEGNQVLTRQMRGFDDESESEALGQSSDNSSDSFSSHSSGLSVNDMLESTTKDENVGAEEMSAEIDAVVPQDASVEGGFQKEATTIKEIVLPKISPTPKPYTESATEVTTSVTTEVPGSPILIEDITESTIDELNEVAESAGDGNHVVVGRPGVDEEFSLAGGTDVIAPLEVEIPSTEKASIHAFNDDGDQGRSLPNNEIVSIVHISQNDSLVVDNVPLKQDSKSEAKGSQNKHSEPLPDEPSKNMTEVVDEPTKEPIAVDQSKPTLPTSEHQELDVVVKQLEIVPPTDFTQQLNDELPTVIDNDLTNPMHITDPIAQNNLETTTEKPTTQKSELFHPGHESPNDISENAIFKEMDEALPIATPVKENYSDPTIFETSSEHPVSPSNEGQLNPLETSTEKPSGRSNEDETTPALVYTLIEAAELTTEFARHVDSFRTTRDEIAAISDEIISTAAAGRSFNAIVAEGLGKPLPTRSVGDAPSTSSYSSEDKTTTVVVLCSSAAIIFIAFSVAMYLITFQRQHGTLDIEMQEQECGKDDLEEDEDAETRVTLLNQLPQVDSDNHSFD